MFHRKDEQWDKRINRIRELISTSTLSRIFLFFGEIACLSNRKTYLFAWFFLLFDVTLHFRSMRFRLWIHRPDWKNWKKYKETQKKRASCFIHVHGIFQMTRIDKKLFKKEQIEGNQFCRRFCLTTQNSVKRFHFF